MASALYRFFFAAEAPEQKRLSLARQYAIILLFYVVTRALTCWVCHERGADPFVNDPGNYVATAQYVTEHHHMPTEDNFSYRQFAGLSLLIAAVNPLFGNMWITGYVITTVSGLLSVILFHHLFRDFRLSLIFCVFLPWWIASNYTIAAQGPTMLGFLLGLWVLRDFWDNWPVLILGLLAAGFSIIIRQTAMFSVMPLVIVYALWRPGGGLVRAILLAAITSLPMAAYLTWNWLTIHELFPQYKLQQESSLIFLKEVRHPEWYGTSAMNLPFHSMIAGVFDPDQNLWKKVSVVYAEFFSVLAMIVLFIQAWKKGWPWKNALIWAMAFALAGHVCFYVCLGTINGFRWVDRYFSEMNALIDFALFYQRPLRWPWIALLTITGLLYGFTCHNGGHFLFFK